MIKTLNFGYVCYIISMVSLVILNFEFRKMQNEFNNIRKKFTFNKIYLNKNYNNGRPRYGYWE